MRECFREWEERIPEKKEKTYLYIGGLLLVLLVFLLGYRNIRIFVQTAEASVSEKRQEVASLLNMQDKMEENEAQTKSMSAKIQEVLAQFPVDVREEDTILYADTLEDEEEVTVTDMVFNQKNLVVTKEKTGYSLYVRPVEITFKAGYSDLKSMLRKLMENGDATNVESITVGYDSDTGNLSGTLVANYYSIEGTDSIYEAAENSGVAIGNHNIFGTAR